MNLATEPGARQDRTTPTIRSLISWAVGLGVLPFALGWIAPSSIHTALIAPSALAFVAFRSLKNQPFRLQILWCASASLASTGTLSLAIACIGALRFLPAPFWLPWLMLFTVTPLLVYRWWMNSPPSLRWLVVVVSILTFYYASFSLCFDFSKHTQPPDVEQLDGSGREPALGPRVSTVGRLICPPRGPSFLFSADYDESEWIWILYRPLVHAWFVFPGGNYYYPYASSSDG